MKTSFEGETAESCPEMEDTNPELLQAQQILIREGKERDLHKYKYKAEFKSREKKRQSLQSHGSLILDFSRYKWRPDGHAITTSKHHEEVTINLELCALLNSD